jgi:hypothetical protein
VFVNPVPFRPAVLALLVMTSCTVIPAREYADFKKSAAEARELGRSLLLDYAAALELKKTLGPQLGVDPAPPAADPLEFRVRDARIGASVDSITVREKAWDVLGRYIETLDALAEGRSADEVGPAVDGLLGAIARFPVAQIADAVSGVSPYIAVAVELLIELEKERSRRKFVESIGKVAPLIHLFVDKLLLEDAQNIYDARLGIFNLQYGLLSERITTLSVRYLRLLQRHQPAAGAFGQEEIELLEKLQVQLKLMPRSAPTGFKPAAQAPATPLAPEAWAEAKEELTQIVSQVKPLVAEARQLHRRMAAFADTMRTYVKVLEVLKESIATLREAAEKNERRTIPVENLADLVQGARRAYSLYKEAR